MWIDKWDDTSLTIINDYFSRIRQAFQNQIEIQDNLYAVFVTFVSSGAPGTLHAPVHTLGRTPSGFISISTTSGTTYCSAGGMAWDANNIFLLQVTSGLTNPPQPGSADMVTLLVF
jgi:hypothetical protein